MAIGGRVPMGLYGEYHGGFRVVGNVTELGVAGRYRVTLFFRRSFLPWRTQVSKADGAYAFDYLPYHASGYFVVAFDDGEDTLNAGIADLVTPEPMP